MASPKLLDQVIDRIRLKHYSLRTEQPYTSWIRQFILFHGKQPPSQNEQDRGFLHYLARAYRTQFH
ncbi:phage integrase N-terminal SAM-like domain-containing protein [Crenobacter sp. SG2303]|uniref:Phage integrase N-terminal SAM-like domain-containing protein n=1 Tax=Crenobacter oryzisoli TaxID=3056844 RepID=A0ABT7XKM5_9NEIS|nr:phage integrase N-terminal SAM-like domain-containing protein [Crenobacter sp. SG2303]MDN0074335.1 phage integrase N-terminal SAM-like domain-containing protein [Crenobacter sp. SG2303]